MRQVPPPYVSMQQDNWPPRRAPEKPAAWTRRKEEKKKKKTKTKRREEIGPHRLTETDLKKRKKTVPRLRPVRQTDCKHQSQSHQKKNQKKSACNQHAISLQSACNSMANTDESCIGCDDYGARVEYQACMSDGARAARGLSLQSHVSTLHAYNLRIRRRKKRQTHRRQRRASLGNDTGRNVKPKSRIPDEYSARKTFGSDHLQR